jgi:hypothetical protein
MREILFKAKRLDSGEWVEGHYVSHRGCCHFIIPLPFGGYIAKDSTFYAPGAYMVDPSTVCEYTGLTDSDGKRVFDGDVLKFRDEPNDYEWIGRVEFGNPNGSYTWGWQLVHMSGPEPNIDTLCWFDMEEVGVYNEVIGTIHDGEGGQHE